MCTDVDFIFVITLLFHCQNLQTGHISQTASTEGELCSTFEGSTSATFSVHPARLIRCIHTTYVCLSLRLVTIPSFTLIPQRFKSKKNTLRIQTFAAPEGRLKHSRQLSWRANSNETRKLSEQYSSEQSLSPPLDHVLKHYRFSAGLHNAGLAVGFNYLKALWFHKFLSYCNVWTTELNAL